MGSRNSKLSTTSRDPYRRVAANINARYPDGPGHARIAAAIPPRRGKPPEAVFLRQNDEGKYACDKKYDGHMEEPVKDDGEGVWVKRPGGRRGTGNIDIRMKLERENCDERQHEDRGEGRVRGRQRDRQRVYAPAGDDDDDDDEKEGGGRRGQAPGGNVRLDKKRQAFVRRKK